MASDKRSSTEPNCSNQTVSSAGVQNPLMPPRNVVLIVGGRAGTHSRSHGPNFFTCICDRRFPSDFTAHSIYNSSNVRDALLREARLSSSRSIKNATFTINSRRDRFNVSLLLSRELSRLKIIVCQHCVFRSLGGAYFFGLSTWCANEGCSHHHSHGKQCRHTYRPGRRIFRSRDCRHIKFPFTIFGCHCDAASMLLGI